MNWTQSVLGNTDEEIITVDGKTARDSQDRKNNRNPLHILSAWACEPRPDKVQTSKKVFQAYN
jgi:hypothetical protein